jgi:hypothetical protein
MIRAIAPLHPLTVEWGEKTQRLRIANLLAGTRIGAVVSLLFMERYRWMV